MEEEGHGISLVYLVQALTGSISHKVIGSRCPLRQLTLQECLLCSCVIHNIDYNPAGLPLLYRLTVHLELSHGKKGSVSLFLIAPVVLVLLQNHLFVCLQGNNLVWTIGHGSIHRCTIVGGYQTSRGILTCLIELLVYQPIGGKGGQEIIEINVSLGYITNGIIVYLVASNRCIIGFCIVLVIVVIGLILIVAVASICEIAIIRRIKLCAGEGIVLCLAPYSLILHGYILRTGIARRIGISLCTVEAPDINIYFPVCKDSCHFIISHRYIVTGVQRIVIGKSACHCALTCVVQVCTIILHLGIQKLLHGVDVGICIDGSTILPLCTLSQLNLKYKTTLCVCCSLSGL